MKILLIGSGGREHALAWKLSQSLLCEQLFCAPGNAGIGQVARCIALSDQAEILSFCAAQAIGLVVVGPEQPLVEGLADALRAAGVPVFGPSAAAAELEGSKAFAKAVMAEAGVRTAAYGAFTDSQAAKDFIRQQGAPIVVKADGLAAGKGVVVAETQAQAFEAVDSLLEPGKTLVIEAFLTGDEASCFVLVDGETVVAFGSAQDHKRVGEGDTGPNTGGMGAYSPAPIVTPAIEDYVIEGIAKPIAQTMIKRGTPFQGVLFIGLMIDQGVPSVLEFNVRFGDPECQVLMMRLESDLAATLLDLATGKMPEAPIWSPQSALTVIMASQGYPGAYAKGSEIKGCSRVTTAEVFHAGTVESGTGQLLATGGRVLAVTAMADSLSEAQALAYQGVASIDWPQGFCRSDIGFKALMPNPSG